MSSGTGVGMRGESVLVSLFISTSTLSYGREGGTGEGEGYSWEEGKGVWVEEASGRKGGGRWEGRERKAPVVKRFYGRKL